MNGKTSKKSMQKKNAAFFGTIFFEVLPYTTLASSVSGKIPKKSVQKNAAVFFCVCLGPKGLDTPKPPRFFFFFFFCTLFFDVLPFTTLASSVNGKTSKKSV